MKYLHNFRAIMLVIFKIYYIQIGTILRRKSKLKLIPNDQVTCAIISGIPILLRD